MADNVVLYTAIYGGYDIPKALPEGFPCDAVLFTDDPLISAPGWNVRVWSEPEPNIPTYQLRHKILKCRPDLAFAADDYDVALWVDGSMVVFTTDYVRLCLSALGDDDVSFVPHPARSCIYTEASFSLGLPRYQNVGIEGQIDIYRREGHPEHWGLFATGANARRIRSPGSVTLGKRWWTHCRDFSYQDQLSLPVIVRDMGSKLRWNVNIPWGQWWGIVEHVPWSGDFAGWPR